MTIAGRVLGQDGKPMSLAHVRLSTNIALTPGAEVQADKRGRFRIKHSVAHESGVQLIFFGTHHRHLIIPLVVSRVQRLELTVRLKAKKLHNEYGKIKVIGDFNGFSRRSGRSLKKRPDGRYQLVVPWSKPRLSYQLNRVAKSPRGFFWGRMAGTHADGYTPKGNFRTYRSWVNTKGGKATIIFDPKRVPAPSKKPKVTWHRATAGVKALWRAYQAYQQDSAKFQATLRKLPRTKGSLINKLKKAGFDVKARLSAVAARRQKSKHPAVKAIMAYHMAQGAHWGMLQIPKAWQAPFCEAWGPGQGLWRIRGFFRYLALFSMRSKRMRWSCMPSHQRYLNELPDIYGRIELLASTARRAYFIYRFKRQAGHPGVHKPTSYLKRLQRMYVKLQKKKASPHLLRYTARQMKFLLMRLSPRRKIRRGKPLPAFRLARLPQAGASKAKKKPWDRRSLRGRWSLIHFWSLWCGACHQDFPGLQRTYKRFRPKGLRILSVALGPDPRAIRSFLRKWKMPWRHGIAFKGFDDPMVQLFEVAGIPRLVLVDPKGQIRAVDTALRGKRLPLTLARLMTPSKLDKAKKKGQN